MPLSKNNTFTTMVAFLEGRCQGLFTCRECQNHLVTAVVNLFTIFLYICTVALFREENLHCMGSNSKIGISELNRTNSTKAAKNTLTKALLEFNFYAQKF